MDDERLFDPETPSASPALPRLIFTEPIDRTAQLFADESAIDLGRAGAATAAPPLWASEQDVVSPRRSRRWLVGSATAAIVCAGGLTWLLATRERGPQGTPVPATRAEAPRVRGGPNGGPLSAAPRATSPASAEGAAPLSASAAPSATAIVREPLPAAPATAAHATPVAEPATPIPLAVAIPPVNVQQLDADAARLLGAPVAAAIIEPPTAPEARAPGVLPGEALPVADPAPTLAAARTLAADRDVRRLLSRYEAAYSSLDADAATAVYPALDKRALSRAFGALEAQHVQLERCDVQVEAGSAKATCSGRASWRPKVGGGSMEQARRWSFDLRQVGGDWQIGSVRVQ